MIKKVFKKYKILVIIATILLLILGTCCSCTGVIYALVYNDPLLMKKAPSESGIIVENPQYTIKLDCNKTETLYLNRDKLSKNEKEKICGKKGFEVELKNGRNLFDFRATNKNANGRVRESTLTFVIIYDKAKYKENLLKDIEVEIGKFKKELRDAESQGLEMEFILPDLEKISDKSVEELEEISIELKEKHNKVKQEVKGAKDKRYEVVRVVDGDTIKIDYDGVVETVRLIGIDTPETKHPQKKVECFGKEASEELEKLLLNKDVKVEFDSTQDKVDKYGRLLLYIWVDDIFVNKYMITNGYAHEYTYNTPYEYQKKFKEAEEEARESKKGLWGEACECEKEEVSRKCTGCEKMIIKYRDWDCSTYTEEIYESSCTNDCEVKGVSISTASSETVLGLEKDDEMGYICDCSKLCGEMSSCDEAYFQLNDCGCEIRDGDNDSVPCESICPGG